jgi:uncharacterized membrane protein YcjF (UPF0283 family)
LGTRPSYNWRHRPPRGWRFRRPFLRYTLANVSIALIAVAVGLITGSWVWAEIVAAIWAFYVLVTLFLGVARFVADKRDAA